jgi:hypothetical protein
MGHSGILGLAFPFEAAIQATTGQSLLGNLFHSLTEDQRFFAVRLSKDDRESSFTIGQLDSALAITSSFGDFFYASVYPLARDTYDYWKLYLDSITIDNATLHLGPSKVSRARKQVAVVCVIAMRV